MISSLFFRKNLPPRTCKYYFRTFYSFENGNKQKTGNIKIFWLLKNGKCYWYKRSIISRQTYRFLSRELQDCKKDQSLETKLCSLKYKQITIHSNPIPFYFFMVLEYSGEKNQGWEDTLYQLHYFHISN